MVIGVDLGKSACLLLFLLVGKRTMRLVYDSLAVLDWGVADPGCGMHKFFLMIAQNVSNVSVTDHPNCIVY